MSTRENRVYDYGLVLDEETIKVIASKVFDDYEDDPYMPWGRELYEDGTCECIGDFVGEAYTLFPNPCGNFYSDCKVYREEDIYYIPVDRRPTLFSQAYDSIEEIVEEFKEAIGEYLPKDFDYRNRICHIIGTYYG